MVAVVIGGGVYLIIQNSNERDAKYQQEQRVQAADAAARWTRLSPDVAFVEAADLDTSSAQRGYRELKLDIKNIGNMGITDVRVSVQLLDCPVSAASLQDCDTIGEDVKTLSGVIPSSQVRQLTATYSFQNEPPPKGRLKWAYHVLAVRGQ